MLSDAQLRELGGLMAHMDANFPLELGEHARDTVLLDLEFKFMPDGELAIKQVRPFLHTAPAPPTPQFQLSIPAGLTVCGTFGEAVASRGAEEEYQRTTAAPSMEARSASLATWAVKKSSSRTSKPRTGFSPRAVNSTRSSVIE